MSFILSLLASFSISQSFAFPIEDIARQAPAKFSVTQPFPSSFTTGYDFSGIVALSNCSGAWVRLEDSKDDDFGLILTNGHCLEAGFPRPGEVIIDQKSNRQFTLLNSGGGSAARLRARRLVYATMTKTDMALYELRETLGEIKKRTGLAPLTLASTHPSLNDQIEVISGYWKRGFTCSIEKFVHQLVEGGWTSSDSIRYSRPGCETYGGTSGSPVVLAGTRTVIGVNNTGNESGQRCTENNPCEVEPDGSVFYQKGIAYGQQTYWVYSCRDTQGRFDFNVSGCELPR